jgi:hypothetical protein
MALVHFSGAVLTMNFANTAAEPSVTANHRTHPVIYGDFDPFPSQPNLGKRSIQKRTDDERIAAVNEAKTTHIVLEISQVESRI